MNAPAAPSLAHIDRLRSIHSSALLDDVATAMESAPHPRHVRRLMAELDDIRRALTGEQWRSVVQQTVRRHRMAAMLREDPYTRRAYERARGSAGDAVAHDFLYDGVCPEHTSTLGRAVFAATVASRSGDAVRARRWFLARTVDEVARETTAATVVAVGCGHAREIELTSAARVRGAMSWFCFDQDRASLDVVAKRWAANPNVVAVPASVRRLLGGAVALPDADLVYAADLLDALDDTSARALLRTLFAATKPGGRLLVANAAPDASDRAYMEAFMDCWLVRRDEGELKALAEGLAGKVRTFRDASGRAVYLELRKFT